MKIMHKLMLAVALPVIMIWVAGYYAANAGEQALQTAIEQNSVARARAIMDEIDRFIHIRIDTWLNYTKDLEAQLALKASNDEFERMSDPMALIDRRDIEWRETPNDEVSPLMHELMETDLAVELRGLTGHKEEHEGFVIFPEVFVTNRFGANIAQTNRTSDYRQDDEAWWQQARRDGQYVSDLGYDESADVYSTDICVRVDDEQGRFIGVIKAVLSIEEVIAALDARAAGHDAEDSIRLTLFTADRRIIHATHRQIAPLGDGSYIFDESGIETRRLNEHHTSLSVRNPKAFSSGDASVAALSSRDDRNTGERLLSTFVASRGDGNYEGLGWILVLERSTDEVFRSVHVLRRGILLICVFATPVALLLGGLVAFPMSTRLKRLSEAAAAIGRGEHARNVRVGGNDELARLARVFNEVNADLDLAQQQAETRARVLNVKNAQLLVEVEQRQQIKKQVEILSRFPTENPNPVMRIEEDGTIAYANDASDPLLAEWGVSIGESLPERWLHMFREARDSGTAIETELECGDRTFLCSMSSVADSGYGYLYGNDITDRKHAERALQESESRMRAIVQCAPDCIISIDHENRILEFNPEAEKTFGCTRNDAIGTDLVELIIPPALREKHRAGMAHYLKTGEGPVLGNLIEITSLRADGSEFPVELAITAIENGDRPTFIAIIRDITERKMAEQSQVRLKAAIEAATETVIITDTKGVIQYVNPAIERITGYAREEAIGAKPSLWKSDEHDEAFYENLWRTISSGNVWTGSFINKRKDGTLFHEEATISPVRDESGRIVNFVAVKRDVSRERQMEVQLRQAQKLESIGQLAAGIAHEINTPTQYVGDNTRFLRDSIKDLLTLIDQYGTLLASAKVGGVSQEQIVALESAVEALDLDFIKEEIPKAIEQSLEGVERVAEIVRAMKDFSHPGSNEKTPTNLNAAIQSTITVCRNQWKYVADLETDFDPDLPSVPCLVSEFNQVVLNIIVNAADAIGEIVGKDGGGHKGRIIVKTRHTGDHVEIRISDTGGGIPEAIRDRVFDPFFTTKEVGKGTGQGLAISHDVIVNKHGGTIELETEPGRGTTFIIRLPWAEQPAEMQRGAA